ncbi:MAG: N-acetylmuramoyl-L-alanine amidase [Gammaproteobacteria bacterium]
MKKRILLFLSFFLPLFSPRSLSSSGQNLSSSAKAEDPEKPHPRWRLNSCFRAGAVISLGIFMLFFSYSAHALATLQSVHVDKKNNVVTLTCNTTQKVNYHYFLLQHPERLVVDLKSTTASKNTYVPSFKSTSVIKQIRQGKQPQQTLRLVIDMNEAPKLNVIQQNRQLLFQLTFKHGVAAPVLTADSQKKHDLIVVIDPGHGGKDPGATGLRGTHEKDVVLAISRDLAALINATPGMKARLTRHSDYFVTLRGRLAIARQDQADIFIAIHADKFRDHHARGASVFALSERGATSEAARWLAKKENESESVGGVDLSDKDRVLKSVLLNLSQNETIRRSVTLGSDVLKQLDLVSKLHHNRVEQARFVVLKSPDIPSILIETGFLSNSYEERLLRSPVYQKKLAHAIFSGVKQYVK